LYYSLLLILVTNFTFHVWSTRLIAKKDLFRCEFAVSEVL